MSGGDIYPIDFRSMPYGGVAPPRDVLVRESFHFVPIGASVGCAVSFIGRLAEEAAVRGGEMANQQMANGKEEGAR